MQDYFEPASVTSIHTKLSD